MDNGLVLVSLTNIVVGCEYTLQELDAGIGCRALIVSDSRLDHIYWPHNTLPLLLGSAHRHI